MTTSLSCDSRIAIGDNMGLWQDRFVRNDTCVGAVLRLTSWSILPVSFPLAGWRGNGLERFSADGHTPLRISTGHRNTATYPYPDIVVLIE